MNLKTKRLSINKPCSEDALEYIQIRNSASVLEFNPMREITVDEALIEFKNENMYVIKLNDVVIGAIFINKDSLRFYDKTIELAYFLDKNYARCGYMSEAVYAVMDELYLNQNIEIITVRVFAKNTASLEMVKKLGFTQEGYLRKCVWYNETLWDDTLHSMTKQEYIEKASK